MDVRLSRRARVMEPGEHVPCSPRSLEVGREEHRPRPVRLVPLIPLCGRPRDQQVRALARAASGHVVVAGADLDPCRIPPLADHGGLDRRARRILGLEAEVPLREVSGLEVAAPGDRRLGARHEERDRDREQGKTDDRNGRFADEQRGGREVSTHSGSPFGEVRPVRGSVDPVPALSPRRGNIERSRLDRGQLQAFPA